MALRRSPGTSVFRAGTGKTSVPGYSPGTASPPISGWIGSTTVDFLRGEDADTFGDGDAGGGR